ncbi:SHOCT domain-containing protein [Halobacteriales archaeon Cl-PHB]
MDRKRTRRHLGRLLALSVVFFLALGVGLGTVAAHTGDGGVHHHDGWMGGHGWFAGGLGFLWMLLLIGGVLALVYLVATRVGSDGARTDDALTTLRDRYARGEIDEEEFESRRRKLTTDRE